MVGKSDDLRKNCGSDVYGWIYSWVSVLSIKLSIVIDVAGSLGDRHCENILLDTVTGDVVHVDFNCLFDKVSNELASLRFLFTKYCREKIWKRRSVFLLG